MSRAISPGYFAAASGIWPPPPKQPQSIDSPRAHALEMPMMNATNRSADTTRRAAHQDAEDQAQPDHDLEDGQQVADGRDDRLRQEVVRPHGAHAVGGMGQLEGAGDDPHATGQQARDEAEPVLHIPKVRR